MLREFELVQEGGYRSLHAIHFSKQAKIRFANFDLSRRYPKANDIAVSVTLNQEQIETLKSWLQEDITRKEIKIRGEDERVLILEDKDEQVAFGIYNFSMGGAIVVLKLKEQEVKKLQDWLGLG